MTTCTYDPVSMAVCTEYACNGCKKTVINASYYNSNRDLTHQLHESLVQTRLIWAEEYCDKDPGLYETGLDHSGPSDLLITFEKRDDELYPIPFVAGDVVVYEPLKLYGVRGDHSKLYALTEDGEMVIPSDDPLFKTKREAAKGLLYILLEKLFKHPDASHTKSDVKVLEKEMVKLEAEHINVQRKPV